MCSPSAAPSPRRDPSQRRPLRSEYSWAYDSADAQAFAALFAADGLCDLGDWGVFRSPEGIEAGIAAQMTAPDPLPATMHCATSPRIAVDGDKATGSWYVTIYHQPREGDPSPVRFVGSYSDEYVRTDEGWKFASVKLGHLLVRRLLMEDCLMEEDLPVRPKDFGEMPPSIRAYITRVTDGVPEHIAAVRRALFGILSHAGDHAERFLPFYSKLPDNHLGPRLTELVRLAIASQTRCATCMTARTPAAIEAGVTEREISLIRELDSGWFTSREKAAIRFALNFAGDHHSIDEEQWDELRAALSEQEIGDLLLFCVTFLGTGRLAMVLQLERAACAVPGQHLHELRQIVAENRARL